MGLHDKGSWAAPSVARLLAYGDLVVYKLHGTHLVSDWSADCGLVGDQ